MNMFMWYRKELSFVAVSCESGSELNSNGGCDLCEIGSYRDAAVSRVCVKCESGKITATKGAKSKEECNIGTALLFTFFITEILEHVQSNL